jgi:hypothetical protein
MDLYDKKLLSKQLQWLYPAPEGVGGVVAMVTAIFFIGITIGVFFPHATP